MGRLDNNGTLSYSDANNGYGSRPVLYLDASVYKIDGDGSLNNPYIVEMWWICLAWMAGVSAPRGGDNFWLSKSSGEFL